MARAIEALLDYKANNIKTFEKFGDLYVNIDDLINHIGVPIEDARDIIDKDYFLKNFLLLGENAEDGLYMRSQGVYGLILNLKSDKKELRVYQMKCYKLLYEAFSPNFTPQ